MSGPEKRSGNGISTMESTDMAERKASGSHSAKDALGLQDTSDETGTDWLDGLKPADPADQGLAVVDLSDPVRQLLDYARAHMMAEEEDTEEVYARMAAQILRANTADEVIDAQDSTKAENILNIPIWCTSITAQDSDEEFAEGVGLFIIVKGIRSDRREEVAVACGGWSVVMEGIRIHMLNELPYMLTIRQKKRKTKRGFYPLYIGRPM